jgi:hypothetical protein
MVTYKEFVELIKSKGESNPYYERIGYGKVDEINDSVVQGTPLLWVKPSTTFFQQNENACDQITYGIELISISQLEKDNSNRLNVMNDTLMSLLSIIKDIEYNNDDVYSIQSTNILPILKNYGAECGGWVAQLTLLTDFDINMCKIPSK